MHHLKKGKVSNQAHVAPPERTYEEEHGRKGFYGKSAHLYHAHPPAGWIRIEGKLRPRCFGCNRLEPSDRRDPHGSTIPLLENAQVRLSVSRRSEPMPFYFRNADGDELVFVPRGMGTLETDEYAVMLDAEDPPRILPAAECVELLDYWKSWSPRKS